jgi:hypothetical protein
MIANRPAARRGGPRAPPASKPRAEYEPHHTGDRPWSAHYSPRDSAAGTDGPGHFPREPQVSRPSPNPQAAGSRSRSSGGSGQSPAQQTGGRGTERFRPVESDGKGLRIRGLAEMVGGFGTEEGTKRGNGRTSPVVGR